MICVTLSQLLPLKTVILEYVVLNMFINYFISRRVQVHVLHKAITKEYEVQEDETVEQLKRRVMRHMRIFWSWASALKQDDTELSDAVKLREANYDARRPLVFTRR